MGLVYAVRGLPNLLGPSSEDLSLPAAAASTLVGVEPGGYAGWSVVSGPSASGPVAAVGAPLAASGAVYVLKQTSGAPITLGGEGQTTLRGDTAGDRVGWSLALGDFDGDGHADLAVGAPGASVRAAGGGEVAIFLHVGDLDVGARPLATADVHLYGTTPGGLVGYALRAVGDLNGDGSDELIIGAPGADEQLGAVYRVNGGPSLGNGRDLGAADVVLAGLGPVIHMGLGVDAAPATGGGAPTYLAGALVREDAGDGASLHLDLFGGPAWAAAGCSSGVVASRGTKATLTKVSLSSATCLVDSDPTHENIRPPFAAFRRIS